MLFKLAALFLFVATAASAQTADDLIARHIEARGGAALKGIQTVRIERTIAATFNDIEHGFGRDRASAPGWLESTGWLAEPAVTSARSRNDNGSH